MKKLKEKKAGRALKRLLATTIVGVVTVTMLPLSSVSTVYADTYGDLDVALFRNPRVTCETAKATIEFGRYPQEDQDNDGDIDWDDATPIRWQVIDDSDPTNALIMAEKVLDYKQFNTRSVYLVDADMQHTNFNTPFEISDLRCWLNGMDTIKVECDGTYDPSLDTPSYKGIGFIDTAFNDTEKGFIVNSGSNKVFVLSVDELRNPIFDDIFSRSRATTSYANSKGCTGEYWTSDNIIVENYVFVASDGHISSDFFDDVVFLNAQEYLGVCPALRINLTAAKPKVVDEIKILSTKQVDYDMITIGLDEDNTTPIKWRILSVDNNKALLFADDILQYRKVIHNDDNEEVTWKNCSLRPWLNSDFYNNAFSTAEKTAILTTNLPDEGTEDFVFSLSTEEITTEKYGFENNWNAIDPARKSSGEYSTRSINPIKKANNGYYVYYVVKDPTGEYDGRIGEIFYSHVDGVRPAMNIDPAKLCSPNKLQTVSLNGNPLTAGTDYAVKEGTDGCAVVTLKPDLVDSLGLGKYTLTTSFDNNGTVTTATTVFEIKIPVTITTADANKEYDTTALTADSYTVSGLLQGHSLESVTISGSQTLVGTSENTASNAKIVDADGKDVTNEYDITYVFGTLTVTEYPGELYINNSTVNSWQKGSGKSLELSFKRAIADEQSYDYFVSSGYLEVDGNTLALGNEYTASKGSIKLSILPEYLETLNIGEHTIKLVLPDGSIQTEISILAANESVNSTTAPYTGDDSHLTAYVIVCILAAAGGAMIVVSNKLKEE